MEPTKPGTKTSEFWVMLIVNAVAFVAPLITEKLEASAAPWALVAASIIVAINTGLYHYSRGLAKQKGATNENLRGELLGALYQALSKTTGGTPVPPAPVPPAGGGAAAGGNGVYHGPAGPGPAGPGGGQSG